MLDNLTGKDFLQEASREGWNWLGKLIAVIVILSVAAFGDVMYVKLMQSVLPTGPLLILCYIGAFTSFLGTTYLLIGKTSLFTPGKQTKWAWVALFFELIMIALNIILVFHGSGDDLFLSSWTWVAPATPVVNMFFVAILFFMDEEQQERHEDKVLESRMRKMDRHYKHMLKSSQMALKHKQLDYLSTKLEEAVNSPDSLAFIEKTARDMNANLLSSFAGRSYNTVPTIEAGQGSGTVPVSLAQQATIPTSGKGVVANTLRPFPSSRKRTHSRLARRRAKTQN